MRMDESNSPKFNWKSQLKAIPPLTLKTGLSGLTFPETWDHYIPVCVEVFGGQEYSLVAGCSLP